MRFTIIVRTDEQERKYVVAAKDAQDALKQVGYYLPGAYQILITKEKPVAKVLTLVPPSDTLNE